jgi:hypothetical protein
MLNSLIHRLEKGDQDICAAERQTSEFRPRKLGKRTKVETIYDDSGYKY